MFMSGCHFFLVMSVCHFRVHRSPVTAEFIGHQSVVILDHLVKNMSTVVMIHFCIWLPFQE